MGMDHAEQLLAITSYNFTNEYCLSVVWLKGFFDTQSWHRNYFLVYVHSVLIARTMIQVTRVPIFWSLF